MHILRVHASPQHWRLRWKLERWPFARGARWSLLWVHDDVWRCARCVCVCVAAAQRLAAAQWCSFHGLPWASMGLHELPWACMGSHDNVAYSDDHTDCIGHGKGVRSERAGGKGASLRAHATCVDASKSVCASLRGVGMRLFRAVLRNAHPCPCYRTTAVIR